MTGKSLCLFQKVKLGDFGSFLFQTPNRMFFLGNGGSVAQGAAILCDIPLDSPLEFGLLVGEGLVLASEEAFQKVHGWCLGSLYY